MKRSVLTLALVLLATTAHADGMNEKKKALVIPSKIDKTLTEPAKPEAKKAETPATPIVVPPPAEQKAAAPAAPAAETAAAPTSTPVVPEERSLAVQPENPSFFGLSVGMYDAVTHGKKAAALNLEFRPALKIADVLQPLAGVIATTNATTMAYAGIGVPLRVGDHFTLLPSFSAGIYDKGDDDGVDLHRRLVYRVGSEFAYEFDDKSRFGLNLHVLTNGRFTGREDRTEVFSLAYTMPLQPYTGEEAATEPQMTPPPGTEAPKQ